MLPVYPMIYTVFWTWLIKKVFQVWITYFGLLFYYVHTERRLWWEHLRRAEPGWHWERLPDTDQPAAHLLTHQPRVAEHRHQPGHQLRPAGTHPEPTQVGIRSEPAEGAVNQDQTFRLYYRTDLLQILQRMWSPDPLNNFCGI